MDKLIGGILVLVIVAVFTVPVGAQNEVYLIPMQSNATCGNTVEVELWVNATNFQGGQINMTYDSECADVTDWTRNTTDFPMGGREHYAGNDWITFTALDSLPDGKYRVGTLTVQCVKGDSCETVLAFARSSELFDAKGNPVAVDWRAGTFKCLGSTSAATTQTSAGGGSGATNTKTETPTVSHAATVTPGMTAAAAPPASILTPTPAAATPSPPVATASAVVSPAPTQPPGEKKEVPGFEAVFAILGLLVVTYLIQKRNLQLHHPYWLVSANSSYR